MTAPSYLTNCEQLTVDLTHGAVQYVWVDIQDAFKQDITGVSVQISLGTFEDPGTWHPADLTQQNGPVWKIRAGLLVGGSLTYPTGTYWAWSFTSDSPEQLPLRSDNRLVSIT